MHKSVFALYTVIISGASFYIGAKLVTFGLEQALTNAEIHDLNKKVKKTLHEQYSFLKEVTLKPNSP